MNILAIETCFGKCSLSFFDGRNFHTKIEETKNQHRNALPRMLEEIMAETGMEIQNLTGVLVNHGPGTFTGIRIGIAFAHGIAIAGNAIAENIPIYGISSMQGVVTKKLQGQTGVAVKAIGEFCYFQEFSSEGKTVGQPLYIECASIPKTQFLLTNCAIIAENVVQIELPNAQNLIERFLFAGANLLESPLYLRQAL